VPGSKRAERTGMAVAFSPLAPAACEVGGGEPRACGAAVFPKMPKVRRARDGLPSLKQFAPTRARNNRRHFGRVEGVEIFKFGPADSSSTAGYTKGKGKSTHGFSPSSFSRSKTRSRHGLSTAGFGDEQRTPHELGRTKGIPFPWESEGAGSSCACLKGALDGDMGCGPINISTPSLAPVQNQHGTKTRENPQKNA